LRPFLDQAQSIGIPPSPDYPADGETKDHWQAENRKENQRKAAK
jgi:hypothetical protein